MPILNGNLKSNGRVVPLNNGPVKLSGKEEIDDTNIKIPNNSIESTQKVDKTSLENGLPKTDENEK
ncbi:unnamed protein product, partial [Rotaria sp. Silwood1]